MSRKDRFKNKEPKKKEYSIQYHICANNESCDGDLMVGLSSEYLFTTNPDEFDPRFMKNFTPRRVHSTYEGSCSCMQRHAQEMIDKRKSGNGSVCS